MKNALARFLRDEQGATAIEYGLIAGLIAMGMIVGATALGNNLSTSFSNLGARILALLPAA
ncbi:Flp family type IVb pilin [Cupriavidus basilensis]|uniref:Flp family type IVb pilin n=1 Tax=Cupriavidus basilensis TaxID=68895 RepID=A0A643FPG5_9BURK|nr:Flp family type IVb pilin [Cupriavidus basilensis]QOT79754.1 Flp family type IVb pilin [Cupriavidus basilensis]